MGVRKGLNRTETLLCVVFVISILSLSVGVANFIGNKPVSEEPEKVDEPTGYKRALGKISPILHILVKDSDGNLKYDYTKEDDLVLKTFLNWTVGWMTDAEEAPVSFKSKDTGGTERTFYTYALAPNTDYYGYLYGGGGYVQIGNGTTSPTRSDYALDEPRETKVGVSDPSYAVGNVTFSGTVTITGNYSASEVGFILRWSDSGSSARDVMVFRDTFTPFSVVVNDQITATYTIMLNNTGFTDNFGNYLAGVFKNVPSTATFTMYDTASVGRTFRLYSGSSSYTTSSRIVSGLARSYIAMGTTFTGLDRTDVQLENIIGTYIGVSPPSHNSSTVITAASQTINAYTNITEAGYFVDWADTTGNLRKIMLWRSQILPNVETQAGYTVTITFRLKS